jgi:hypothetical protein
MLRLVLVVAGLLLPAAVPAAEDPAAARGPAGPGAQVVGAVRSVDIDARSCEVLAGRGHALRVVKIVIEPETRITRKEAAIGVPDLRTITI